jgi:hypothetical protein
VRYALAVLLIFLASLAWCANHYVRDGATGTADGSDWTNAWDDLPATFVRGDTYYIADGAYGGHTFDTATSGTLVIYIKKATASAHGTDTGWLAAYGDGVATFTGQLGMTSAAASYLDIDGVVGSGTSGHGFKFQITGTEISLVNFWDFPLKTDIAFRHCELTAAGEDQAVEQSIMRVYNVHNLTVQSCYLHDVETTIFQIYGGCYGFTLEYSVVARRHNGTANHGEHIMLSGFDNPAAIMIRFNIMFDCFGSGMVYFDNSDHPGGAEIYGNVFYQTSNRYQTSNGLVGGGSSYVYSDIHVYNNTMVDAYGASGNPDNYAVYLPGGVGSGNEAINNLAYATGGITISNGTKSHNLYNDAGYAAADAGGTGQNWTGGTGLFTSYAGDDYTLTQATTAGMDLGVTFDEDMLGNPRGTWDRGAYEYGSGPPIGGFLFR